MKGLLGLVFLGICIIVGAALLAGPLTFHEATSFIFAVLFWIAALVVIMIAAVFGIIIIALAQEPRTKRMRG